MFEKGKKPCPKCKVRYIGWRETECAACYYKEHPEKLAEKEARQFKLEQFKRDLKKKKNKSDREFRKKMKDQKSAKPNRDWDGVIFH